jgi:hypothetical protein
MINTPALFTADEMAAKHGGRVLTARTLANMMQKK